MKEVPKDKLPLKNGQDSDFLINLVSPIIFDNELFGRKVEKRSGADMVAESAINFYGNVNQKEVEAFYKGKTEKIDPHPVSLGLNSKVSKKDGKIIEEIYKSGGLYGRAIDQIIMWLEKAKVAAESDFPAECP